MSSTRFLSAPIALAFVIATGCNTMRREVVVPAHHPANADAIEAPMPPPSTTLTVAPSPPTTDTSAEKPRHHPVHHHVPASAPAAGIDAETH
jgi:hypothetical protein